MEIRYIGLSEFERFQAIEAEWSQKLSIIADACRLNAFCAVKNAGSGHLGSSFSAIDIMALLYFRVMSMGSEADGDRDIFLSSKGHDCPAQYSVLAAKGTLPFDKLFKLRRLNGLYGHPDVSTPGIEANTGSLGMGISKGKGMAWAKRKQGRPGRVFVMSGDGELQEGQNWEALQGAAHQGLTRLTLIVDANKVQTDQLVEEIVSLGALADKFRDFGWEVLETSGHDFHEMDAALTTAAGMERPSAIIAHTIKGRGISFMEGSALELKGKEYRWHSGAPDDQSFFAGYQELLKRLNENLREVAAGNVQLTTLEDVDGELPRVSVTSEKVVSAFGESLTRLAHKHSKVVVLDGDLASDCGLRSFRQEFPDRFIENGIAEQDMVSTAGGLARMGFLPVVNSFASFLSSRANEQIYNNATERSKVIYACHFAGLIPAGPGKSHQSVRDISLLTAIPNCTIIEPCNSEQTDAALRWCIEESDGPCVLRLIISASPRRISLSPSTPFKRGVGDLLRPGVNGLLISHGPVLLHESLTASEILAESGLDIAVANMPWLNSADPEWLETLVSSFDHIFVAENHAPIGGLSSSLLDCLASRGLLQNRTFRRFSVEGHLACGTPWEVLRYHRLDARSLAQSIAASLGKPIRAKQNLLEIAAAVSGGADVQ